MTDIKTRNPLRGSIPPPDLPGVKFGTDSMARIPVAWTRPQPTTSADVGVKLDPQSQMSGRVEYGSTGTVQYSSTEHPDGPYGNSPNPYTPGATEPHIIAADDRLPLAIGSQPNPQFGGKAVSPSTSEATSSAASTGPGTGRDFAPKLARLGQTTTQVAGFGNQSPSGSGLLDQQEQSPTYNPQIDPRRVYGKVWKSRFGQH